jgi:hypothetical protein
MWGLPRNKSISRRILPREDNICALPRNRKLTQDYVSSVYGRLVPSPLLLVPVSGQVVHGDSQEHVQQDEVAADEQDQEVGRGEGAQALNTEQR